MEGEADCQEIETHEDGSIELTGAPTDLYKMKDVLGKMQGGKLIWIEAGNQYYGCRCGQMYIIDLVPSYCIITNIM